MRVVGLPAIPSFSSGNWRLERSVAVAQNPFGNTRQRVEFDGYQWRCALRCPPYTDDDSAVLDAWLDEVSRGDRWLYITPPQHFARGAWSPAELVSNGTFIGGATTGWTAAGAALSVNNRRLKVKNTGAAIGTATQSLTVTADVPYLLLVDLHEGNVEAWRVRLLDGSNAEEHVSYYNKTGRVPIVHIPSSTTLKVELGCNTAVSGDDVKFNNVRAARCLLVDDSLAVGNRLKVKGGPASTDAAIKAGEFVTIRLWNGWQMVRLTEDFDADSGGKGTLRFEPALRAGVMGGGPVVVHAPFMRCTLAEHVSEAGLEAPKWRGFAVDAIEDPGALAGEVPQDTDLIWAWYAETLGLAPTVGSGTPAFTGDVDNWYVDSDGVLKQVAAANTPVFEFNPITKALKGLRFQRAKTNIAWPSEDWSHANFIKTDTTITADQRIAPNGVTSMDLLTQGVAGTADVTDVRTGTADASYAVSRYFARGNHDWVLFIVLSSGDQLRVWFNLATGAVGTTSALGTAVLTNASIEPGPFGTYRCSIVGTIGNGATVISCFTTGITADGGTTRVSGGTRYEWGAQFEDSAVLVSSYIQTTSGAVARTDDQASDALLEIPGNLTSSEYTLSAEIVPSAYDPAEYQNAVTLGDGTANERSGLYRAPGSGELAAFCADGGATQFFEFVDVAAPGAPARWAAGFKANDYALSSFGGVSDVDSSGTMPTVTTLFIGYNGITAGGEGLNGYLRRLFIYKKKKPNRQIRSLSS